MRTFKHPTNGYTESVGFGSSVGVFFLGALYLAIKGLWRHVFIWLVIVVPISLLTGGVGLVLLVPLACLIYAIAIQDILVKDYLVKGWIETTNGMNSKVPSTSSEITEPWRTFDKPSSPAKLDTKPEHKKCPFCAEDIKVEAIKCKHCQSELTTA
jgi:hypothetical protein